MHDVPLSERLYRRAAQAALESRVSLEAYVAEAVEVYLRGGDDAHDHLFTPEVLAAIDKGGEEAKEGKGLTDEAVGRHFAERRKAWLENHAG